MAPATTQAMLLHTIREPVQTASIIPSLTNSSLLSISKFVDANYLTFFTPQDVQFFNCKKLNVVKTSEPILWGWWDKHTGLWRIPLIPTSLGSPLNQSQASNITNKNNSLNKVYDFPAQTKLSGTTMQWPGSSQKQHGPKPSKLAFTHHGQCKWLLPWQNTSQSHTKCNEATWDNNKREYIHFR